MGQFSMKILPDTGSRLDGNQQAVTQQRAENGENWFQREFKGIEAGDIFSLPLQTNGYAFGRVMNAHDGAQIAEFFRHWQPDNAYSEAIPDSGRLFSPIGIMITQISYRNRKRPWQVIHKDPEYYPDDLYEIPFLSASGPNYEFRYYTLNNIRKELGPVTKKEAEEGKVCEIMPQHPGWITNFVEKLLKAQGLLGG